MPEEACALVCAIFSLISAILSGYTMLAGEWDCMILTLAFSAVVILLVGYVMIVRYCR